MGEASSILRIGTRGSQLALAQTRLVFEALKAAVLDVAAEIDIIRTSGDISALRNEPIERGKADFVREIETALLDHRIDAAVHSLKDMPVGLPPELALAAFLRRANPRDALVSRAGWGLGELPPGARVGTSSPRRRAMLLRARPDVQVVALRGNVPTRVRKLDNGDYDAIVVARAGLERLRMTEARYIEIEEAVMLPAPCQGIVAVETRTGERETLWAAIDNHEARTAALCERAVVRALGADCHAPLGVYARLEGAELVVEARWLSLDGCEEESHSLRGPTDKPEELGKRLAGEFCARM